MRLGLSIAAKLAIAYGLFLAPIVYLGFQMISDKENNIAFARKEIRGAEYIAVVRGVQDAVVRGRDLGGLSAQIEHNEATRGVDLNTGHDARLLQRALAGTDRGFAAQAAAALIRKAADGSNLTLDPDLDSYYTQDALTVKLPAAVAKAASIASAVASTAGRELSVEDAVRVGVQIDGLKPVMEALARDIDYAAMGNPDATVATSVAPSMAVVDATAKRVLALLADPATAADAQRTVLPLLDALLAAGIADSDEVKHLLKARIDGFRSAEMINSGVALALFLIAVLYVLVVVQRGVVRPLKTLTRTMRDLADRNLTVEIGGMIRGDEVGDMARAVQVFKESMIRAEALASREAAGIRASERRFRALVQNTSDLILICTGDGEIAYQSPAAASIWHYAADDLSTLSLTALVHAEDQPAIREVWEQLRQAPSQNEDGATRTIELRLRDANGVWRDAELIATNVLHEPAIRGMVVTVRDVSQRKAFENQLTQQAFYDSLTGLPNRVLFHERLEQAVVRADRTKRAVGLMFLDLDKFKLINDSLGHEIGDQLLIEAAARLRGCVSAHDTVARLGGDEFVILLDMLQEEDAARVAKAIARRFSVPFVLGGREIIVTASIGIAASGPGREPAASLLRDADIAMYRAKSDGRARYAVFHPSMHTDALARLELENDLRHASERGELRVHYQPMVTMASGAFTEVEALVRWNHPTRGLIAPGAFIPIAEDTGLIVPLGLWVLREACRQVALWQSQSSIEQPLTLSVNLSPRQFQQPSLVADVAQALQDAQLPAGRLKLEITESVIMRDTEATIRTLRELKGLGLRIAIDDFGTGYSSLSYLRRLPIDVLKIDRSFINGIGRNQEDTAIVHAIMAMAKSLNLMVTGEGIETTQQAVLLSEWGCDLGQGYLFSKPLDSVKAGALLGAPACPLDDAEVEALRLAS